jgi:diguanylate cyclase (GGDEF)-like protein
MLLVDFSYAEATHATRTRGTFIIVLSIFATICIWVLIVFLLRRRIYQPVHHLITAFTRLGQGDLTTRAKVLSDDELGELTLGFNTMAERLQVQMHELERKNIEITVLYNLVDRASQSMELKQLQLMVVEAMIEKLSIEKLMFIITLEQEDNIVCTGTSSISQDGKVGQLNEEDSQHCLKQIPNSLLESTQQSREPIKVIIDGKAWFAITIWIDDQNVGCLTGMTAPGNPPSDSLLRNLAAHICLAIENSQNYSHSITDPMTKMHTKGYGLSRIDEAIQTFKRTGKHFGLLILDLDHFKQVNDTYGHLAGDQVLREATKRIRKRLRSSDIGIRYGGEEFIALLCDVDEKLLTQIAEEFRQTLAVEPIPLHNDNHDSLPITMSVGGAAYS